MYCKETPIIRNAKGANHMKSADYESALNYLLWGQWDDLFTLMIRTNDDILRKKIHVFLHQFHFSIERGQIMDTHDNLLHYIDHAIDTDFYS